MPRDHDFELECRYCGTVSNSATEAYPGQQVTPGASVFICLHCGTPSVYDYDLSLREPTVEEYDRLVRNHEFLMSILATHKFRARFS